MKIIRTVSVILGRFFYCDKGNGNLNDRMYIWNVDNQFDYFCLLTKKSTKVVINKKGPQKRPFKNPKLSYVAFQQEALPSVMTQT
jgi:hypothetical protein